MFNINIAIACFSNIVWLCGRDEINHYEHRCKRSSSDKRTYRHKLHVPLGWRLQQRSRRKGNHKEMFSMRLVSNAISNISTDIKVRSVGNCFCVYERHPTHLKKLCSLVVICLNCFRFLSFLSCGYSKTTVTC